jgi:GT2 family glycosyltransferase
MLNLLTLTWNGADKLSKLHQSLMPALEGIEYVWFVKDNGSKDNTVEMVKSWGGNIHVIAYKDNQQNFSTGCNYLFSEAAPADNDYVMLLNNDVVINDTTSIKQMLNIMQNDKSVGAVGARLLYSGTDKLQHAGVVFNKNYGAPMHFRSGQVSDENAIKDRQFQVVTGAVLLTKADYFKNAFKNKSGANGMDENYHWAFDDVDLCLSIKYNMEKKIVYCGGTNIFHEESASLKKNPVNKLFMNHNFLYLLEKWKGRYSVDKDMYTNEPKYNLYRAPEPK